MSHAEAPKATTRAIFLVEASRPCAEEAEANDKFVQMPPKQWPLSTGTDLHPLNWGIWADRDTG